MANNNLKAYIDKISRYEDKELEEEYKKLHTLLSNIYQEYRDREETIFLISSQMDEVRNRLSSYEEQTI